MVYVDNQPAQQQPINVSSGVNGILDILKNNWAFLLVLILAIVGVYLAYYFWKKAEEERKERDSDQYTLYNSTLSSCESNADKTLIKKQYSLLNLLWLGIPFKMIEKSKKYIDVENKLIGWYRGHFISQDGYMNILLYKTKSFIFFENKFVVKYPIHLKFKDNKHNVDVNIEKTYTSTQYNKDTKINCYGLEKIGLYYYIPVFVLNPDTREVLDLRAYVENTLRDDSFQVTNARLVGMFSQASKQMIELNPHVQRENAVANVKQRSEEIQSEQYDGATGRR